MHDKQKTISVYFDIKFIRPDQKQCRNSPASIALREMALVLPDTLDIKKHSYMVFSRYQTM